MPPRRRYECANLEVSRFSSPIRLYTHIIALKTSSQSLDSIVAWSSDVWLSSVTFPTFSTCLVVIQSLLVLEALWQNSLALETVRMNTAVKLDEHTSFRIKSDCDIFMFAGKVRHVQAYKALVNALISFFLTFRKSKLCVHNS
jgi:hypothetical protein